MYYSYNSSRSPWDSPRIDANWYDGDDATSAPARPPRSLCGPGATMTTMSDGCGRGVRDRGGGGGDGGAWRGWFLGGSSIFLLCGGCRNTWWRLWGGGGLLWWEMGGESGGEGLVSWWFVLELFVALVICRCEIEVTDTPMLEEKGDGAFTYHFLIRHNQLSK